MSNTDHVRALIHKRGLIKAQLTRFKSFLDKYNKDNVSELKIRLGKIDAAWDEFNEIQTQIELEDIDNIQIHSSEGESFEEDYFHLVGIANQHIKNESIVKQISDTNESQTVQRLPEQELIQFKLPTINLPTFSGSYSQWPDFYDTFSSMIHNNTKIDKIHKFHYLKSSLKDEAAHIIQSLEISSANYEVAWSLVRERYDNKRLIIQSHLKALFDTPTVIKDSYVNLRNLLDNFTKHIRALKVLDQPTDEWNAIIVYIISAKLDKTSLRAWEHSISHKDYPTMEELFKFLENRCRVLEATSADASGGISISAPKPNKDSDPKKRITHAHTARKVNVQCPICKQSHHVYYCQKFLSQSVDQRRHSVLRAGLCLNCLKAGHQANQCQSRSCKRCAGSHNTLLHCEAKHIQQSEVSTSTLQSNQTTSQTNENPLVNTAARVPPKKLQNTQVLLSTAVVKAEASDGTLQSCRILLDSGSQSHFITSECAQRLKLKQRAINIPVMGINQATCIINQVVHTTIQSTYNNFKAKVSLLVMPEITNILPTEKINIESIQIPSHIQLADPEFHTPSRIDILIGAELFFNIFRGQSVQISRHIHVQQTHLGWIISGRAPIQTQRAVRCHMAIEELASQIKQFWEQEECSPQTKVLSTEERECEQHFRLNTERDEEGRFVVKLPFKKDPQLLGDSHTQAYKRFNYLERTFMHNSGLKQQYDEFLNEYKNLGHMSECDTDESTGFFLPHHAIIKNDSLTTKIRVVFDASARTSTGISLNDTLMVGPIIQDDLYSILVRFRTHQIVLTADVEKMYRQVLIHPKDRIYQKILYRSNQCNDIQCYSLSTVTYGTASAPYLAVKCLHELADQTHNSYPTAAKKIKSDFYVDDLLTGANSLTEAVKLKKELEEILANGKFSLRKWSSNIPELFQSNDDTSTDSLLYLNPAQKVKVLGIQWDSCEDSFVYSVNLNTSDRIITKRSILSQIARLYDPLGLLGPIIVIAKIIMQQLWTLQADWDQSIPDSMQKKWLEYQRTLLSLEKVKIPRKIIIKDAATLEIHGFCDSSEAAYGACLYMRSTNQQGHHSVQLICAKSRVAPLKTLSLPRLELCGATLLVDLYQTTIQALKLQINKSFFWTDSSIVLHWINTSPHLLKTFISNRVSKIQSVTNSANWRHVSSEDNPSDLISRGCNPNYLQTSIWFHGPSWLSEDVESWPASNLKHVTNHSDSLEYKSQVMYATITNVHSIFNRYSSFLTLLRVTAWVMRFKNNCTNTVKQLGHLTVQELRCSKLLLVKLSQQETFSAELYALRNQQPLHNKSKLICLSPYLDDFGVIRVGGRLKSASITDHQRHPFVLAKNHMLIKLLIQHFHETLLHAGPTATLAQVRLEYWPLSGRSAVRGVLRKCVKCFKAKPVPLEQQMGNLPHDRVNVALPFAYAAVDYAGPILIRESRRRGRIATHKCYIAVFICLVSKAMHLELVSSLSCEAFLSALRRFIARRGNCIHIYSDNGTNFVAANKELKLLHRQYINHHQVQASHSLVNQGITWHFSPPYSPHHGGLWEAGVKSVKTHIKRVIGNTLLTFEEYYTLLVQVEAVLNSRPLTPLSSDPNDLIALTPSHFLHGSSQRYITEPDWSSVNSNRLSRWQLIQKLHQDFWKRWSREYLSSLNQRTKWKLRKTQIRIGDLVLLRQDNTPPFSWPLGRVTELHTGADGLVRVVTVRTINGEYKRAIQQLCLLPVEEDSRVEPVASRGAECSVSTPA